MIRKNTLNQQGFSLVEAIIAMAILAVGLITLVTMQVTGVKGNATANNITNATVIGVDQIERIFSWPLKDYTGAIIFDEYDELIDNVPPYGAAGLDETGATADFQIPTAPGEPLIYLNIAEDLMMPRTKTMRFIILRDDIEAANIPVAMEYIKAELM